MQTWTGALWGACGGLVLEGFDFVAASKNGPTRWPWLFGKELSHGEKWGAFAAWSVGVLIRVGAGGLTAAAFTAGGLADNVWTVFSLGVAGPAALERATAVAK